MPARKITGKIHIEYHRDGSIWAKGRLINDTPTGYWEWFRKDGTKMRSGYFERGRQIGEWTTFDKRGCIVKVTAIKESVKKVHG
jgi:antitoxin component YwqK of YwqJK toxin-antitoxin module